MGYLMMCALSAWAGRSGRCVLPFLSPRAAPCRLGVSSEPSLPRRVRAFHGRDCAPVWWISSGWSCDRPSPSRTNGQAAGVPTRPHGHHGVGHAGNSTPAGSLTPCREGRCFRHQLLLPRPYLVLTKPLRLDIQCQRAASVKIGWKYLDD